MALVAAACNDTPVLGGFGGAAPAAGSTGHGTGEPTRASIGGSDDGVDDDGEPGLDGGAESGGAAAAPDAGPPPGPAGPHFVDVTVEAGLDFDPGPLYSPPFCLIDSVGGTGDYCVPEHFLGAVAVGDYDDDQWPDVFLTRIDGPGLLMRNLGDGTFEDVAAAVGLEQTHITGGAAWVDIEGDGDLDLLQTGFGTLRHFLYINDGSGHFEERGLQHGVALPSEHVHIGTGIGVGDYDLDGYVDLFVGDWRPALILGARVDYNRLLHNRGIVAPGRFEDVTALMRIDLQAVAPEVGALPGGYGFGPGFADFDGDHWPDLSLAADYGTSRMYWNDGTGTLRDGTDDSDLTNSAHGMGSALGDYDGDGDLDWFISAIYVEGGVKGNRMFRNEGNRSFVEVTDELGVRDGGWGWGATFFDADHDGDLDLALASGWPSMAFSSDPVRLWLNDGPGPWPEVALELGIDYQNGRGLVTFDYDRDGDLDLLVHGNTDPPALYRNDGAVDSWLQVRAIGVGGNTRSIGATVRVQAQPGDPWQVRTIGVGSHLFGQEDAVAHFGLGPGAQPLHRVEVRWPASGRVEMHGDVARDQVLVVHE